MSEAASRPALAALMVVHLLLAAAKLAASAVSGSAALLAEGIHSLADAGDGLLLFVGLRRSAELEERLLPVRRGADLYFWTLVVAVIVFAAGGAMAAYGGVQRLVNPQPLRPSGWTYLVLAVAAIFEGSSLTAAARDLMRERGDRHLFRALRQTRDPGLLSAIFIDSAGLLGVVAAFAGILLGSRFSAPRLDAGAALVIGFLLLATAALLVWEIRNAALGEVLSPDVAQRVCDALQRDPAVTGVSHLGSARLGPDETALHVELHLCSGLGGEERAAAVVRAEAAAKRAMPGISRVFVEALPEPAELH